MSPELNPAEISSLSSNKPLTSGDVLCERYRVGEKLGSGAFGQVFAAEDLGGERRVAIKVLREGAGMRDPDAVARLRQEAEILEAIEHPNIVEIYEVGQSEHGRFMVMELLDGRSIDQLLVAEGPAEPERVARVARQMLSALAASHAKGVLHRDLKPENIILVGSQDGSEDSTDEQAKLLDFGIAKAQEILDDDPDGGITLVKTRGGGFMGTPRYCAPEIVVGDPVEASADIFSLGLVLAEWLTGRERIAAEKQNQALGILIQPEPLDVSDCPEIWRPWLAKMIAKDPADRYASAEEALVEFDMIVGGQDADPTELIPQVQSPEPDFAPASESKPAAVIGEDFVSDTAETRVRDLPTVEELEAAKPVHPALRAPSAKPAQSASQPATQNSDFNSDFAADSEAAGTSLVGFVLVALGSCAVILLAIILFREFAV
jgi:serine/threonine protein kinase